MADTETLDILLNGQPVGTLHDFGSGRTLFDFEQAYLNDADRPTLGLAFGDGAGGINSDTRPEPGRLAPFFSNLLPEGELLGWMAPHAGSGGEFALLGALGGDLPGAVSAAPGNGTSAQKSDAPMRFSLTGMGIRFPAIAGPESGLTVPEDGRGGDWIVKPPSPRWQQLPENEFAMMQLARLAGIAVAETRLVPVADIGGLPAEFVGAGGQALATRRIDRAGGAPVHTEDFAQVFGVHPERKYNRGSLANIAQVLSRAADHAAGLEFIRRIVFDALVGNCDAHLKNWSLAYPDGRTPALAPAQGLASTIAYVPTDIMALKVSRSRKFADFGKGELLHLAERAALPRKAVWDTARETVQRFHEAWAGESANLPIGDDTASAIAEHFGALPLVREA